jgi:hypothetical protein
MKVFDWDKAATLIKEKDAKFASAGLSGDWEYTGGLILEDGSPNFDDYTFLASTWATPELVIDGEFIDCYVMESQTEWDSGTKWPQSALDILHGSEKEADANE